MGLHQEVAVEGRSQEEEVVVEVPYLPGKEEAVEEVVYLQVVEGEVVVARCPLVVVEELDCQLQVLPRSAPEGC